MPLPEPLPPISSDAPKPGSLWQHFKGGACTVIGVSRHTETGDVLVNYLKDGEFWSRPLSMWADQARPGIQRFTEVA